MNQFLTKQFIQTILLCLLVFFFGTIYSQTVLMLPLFGDATIHGANAIDVLTKGWSGLQAEYPSFYSYLMAILSVFFGEKGFNLVPFLGFIFLLFSTFLFIRQITNNYYASLFSVILVGSSPKIVFYSARMYQEILIGAFFIFCLYLLFRYLKEKQTIFVILLAFFVGIAISIKQQGLFILYPAIALFFLTKFFLSFKYGWVAVQGAIKNFLIVVMIPLFVGVGFYGVLFHTMGRIQPGSDEFSALKLVNSLGQQLFVYENSEKVSFNTELEESLNKVHEEYSEIAFKRAEQRHIWPTEIFTDIDKFNQANNLYIPFQGIQQNLFVMISLFLGLIGGIIYCCIHYQKYSDLLLFASVFLPINYVLFMRNSDQQRYHLFIPVFLLAFVLIFFIFIFKRITLPKPIRIIACVTLIIFLFLPSLVQRIELNTNWKNSQLYSPSEGGIASIQEAGDWMKNHSDKNTIVGQQCNNETHYYFQRPVIGDWRVYFLQDDDLKSYFQQEKISYYVVYTSQIVDDKEWEIICWVPRSFYQRMEKNYARAYTSNKKDIIIYKITL